MLVLRPGTYKRGGVWASVTDPVKALERLLDRAAAGEQPLELGAAHGVIRALDVLRERATPQLGDDSPQDEIRGWLIRVGDDLGLGDPQRARLTMAVLATFPPNLYRVRCPAYPDACGCTGECGRWARVGAMDAAGCATCGGEPGSPCADCETVDDYARLGDALATHSARAARLELLTRVVLAAHEGQLDKQGAPYAEHILAVRERVSDEAKPVALFHDVIEDGRLSRSVVEALLDVDEARAVVQLLTRREGESYFAYVENIARAPGRAGRLAREVKLADIEHNRGRLTPELESLRARYERARMMLEQRFELRQESPPVDEGRER